MKMMDETLQAVSHQSARRKSDLHDVQQERDSLKHNVTVLNKQLHDVNDKVRFGPYQGVQESTALCMCAVDLTFAFVLATEPCFGEGLALDWSH